MSKMIKGEWFTEDKLEAAETRAYKNSGGKFQRAESGFRNWVTADGSAGPSGEGGFQAEAGRYHLFAALNCPWAHRTLIYRKVKQLESIVSLSYVAPLRTDQGWVFSATEQRFEDTLHGRASMHEYYSQSDPGYTGIVTVPVLWDKQQNTIVSNESAEIIRMFNSAFNEISGDTTDYYPAELAADIDAVNQRVFDHFNNGVYKAGFARTQRAYEEAVTGVFETLDLMESKLADHRYIVSEQITEADWRMLPTLVRFDVAYYSAFKCNLRAIRDYPRLSAYLLDLYNQPGIAETVDLEIYRMGYHSKSPLRNPHGILPVGLESMFVV